MNQRFDLKGLGQHLRQVTTCPVCGKSRLVVATAWKGRGTGRRGEAAYDATAFEGVTAETHCTCPGGPAHHLVKQSNENE